MNGYSNRIGTSLLDYPPYIEAKSDIAFVCNIQIMLRYTVRLSQYCHTSQVIPLSPTHSFGRPSFRFLCLFLSSFSSSLKIINTILYTLTEIYIYIQLLVCKLFRMSVVATCILQRRYNLFTPVSIIFAFHLLYLYILSLHVCLCMYVCVYLSLSLSLSFPVAKYKTTTF